MEMREKQREWVKLYKAEGLTVDAAYVMTAFGCNFEGEIPQERVLDDFRFILDLCADENIPLPILVIADTMGWGNPEAVKRMIGALRDMAPEARLGMHIHDTRGLGIANVYAALSMGVDMFESSVAGQHRRYGIPVSRTGDRNRH
jgi:hydroxymethylglutaryl-CoA lyase